jgi:peptidoglycan/LPS O-acetylase OafA/YrhL
VTVLTEVAQRPARSAAPAPVAAPGFRADIQGIRAVAVGLVVLYHAGVPWMSGGYVGVDVFFVVSGFLITGHLVAELDRTGTVRLGAFYARRIRRLLPASALVLAVTIVAAKVFVPPLGLRDVSRDALGAATYLSNILFARTGTNYLANDAPSLVQHYWSLAVEEQFYLLWPALILLAGRHRLHAKRGVTVAILVVSAMSFAVCVRWTGTAMQPWAYFTLPSRAWELGCGAILALVARPAARRLGPSVRSLLAWCGLAAVVVAAIRFGPTTSFPGTAATVPVLGTVALILGGTGTGVTGPVRLLRRRPLQFVGDISYPLYLWHWPLLVLPTLYRADPLSAQDAFALVVLAVGLATLTHRFVERPVARATHRVANGPTFVGALGVTTVSVVAALAVGVLPHLSSGPPVAGWPAAAAPADVPVPDTVPGNLAPSLVGATNDVPSVYADGCHADYSEVIPAPCSFGDPAADRTIVLFGDSHAAQWFPALRTIVETDRARLVVFTKSSCPSVSVDVRLTTASGRAYTECTRWRAAAIEQIGALRPAVVVIANYRRVDLSTPAADEAAVWAAGLGRTLAALPPGVGVVLSDTPTFQVAPAICLSAHLGSVASCGAPTGEVVDRAHDALERATTLGAGDRFIDTSAWTCPGAECEPIRGNVLLYRDRHHLTTHAADALAPTLRTALGL